MAARANTIGNAKELIMMPVVRKMDNSTHPVDWLEFQFRLEIIVGMGAAA